MNLIEHFHQLDAWLAEHQQLWRAKPFIQHPCDWEAQYPELATWLRNRTLEQAEQAHNKPYLLDAPAPFGELAQASFALSQLPDWTTGTDDNFPELLERHIPGRKWQQITRFAQVSQARWQYPVRHWVDWCAGKGHLGRLLAWQSGQPLLCLERSAELNHAGELLSRQFQLAARHQTDDVLEPRTWQHLAPEHTLVALHACGQLHMTLLEQAVAQKCKQLALAPCCYNRIDQGVYAPLSVMGAGARLELSKGDLALPMQESVTAGQRTRQARDRSMAWRLAFDLWQRGAGGVDQYLPTPSRPESAMKQPMAMFCRDMASFHGLQLREPDDWQDLERRGWQRLAHVRNLELVRGLFRRPLEIWLLLDRALFMQEAGYHVEIGLFCPSELTPRNILLVAEQR